MTYVKRWIPLLILLLLAAVVMGCGAGLTSEQRANLTPSARVYEIKLDYANSQQVALKYLRQPTCSETRLTACKSPDVVNAIADADLATNNALDSAELLVRDAEVACADPEQQEKCLDLTRLAGSAAGLARSALAAFTSTLIQAQ